MNNLLLDEYPLIVLPTLAKKIGLNESIMLQQIHFWIRKEKHLYDGKYWVYNTYKEWEKQFAFWSISTIRRTMTSLEKQNLILTGNYNKAGFDNTKWYTINYGRLFNMSRPFVQNEQTTCSRWAGASVQNEQTNTIDYPETNNIEDIVEIVTYLNDMANRNYRHTTRKTQSLIRARMNEGFTVDDFKRVIDIKTDEWLNDSKMNKYLRPETLFGTKFESYLNQETTSIEYDPSKDAF